MQTTVECVCFHDISVVHVVHKNIEAAMDGPDGTCTSNKAPTCVTEHPGFLAVCTNGCCRLPVISTYSSTREMHTETRKNTK